MRGLCIIRLIGLLVFAGVANVCATPGFAEAASSGSLSSNTQGAGSQPGNASGAIRDPLNPQAYMSQLASKLNSSDGKGLLLKGMERRRTHEAGPSQAKAVAPKPVAKAGVAVVPAYKPVQVSPAGPGEQKPQASKPEPVPQVSTMTVWNGLSPDNRAAQRAMEEMGTARMAKAPPAAQPTGNEQVGTVAADQTAQTASSGQSTREVSPLNQALMSAKPGLTLWTQPTPANLVEKVTLAAPATTNDPNAVIAALAASQEQTPWSVGTDLDKYRAHAVKEGARDSGESLKKALERAGLAIGDGVNVFILGYGSDRAKPFRGNDGKGFLDEPGKVPQRAGDTVVSFADGVYSLADLIALDSLPDPLKAAYKDNNPLVRPLVFTGRTIGGAWKTTEEIGNAVTWGYFDNVTGCVGIVIEDILELFKHVGQAATNLVRAPVQLVAGKKEGTERAMDWVLLVPLEFVSNSVQMKGIANMDDYKTAFADKGVIGSVLELGGSTFVAYRAVDELIDELKDKDRCRRTSSDTQPDTPPDTPPEPPLTPGTTTGSEMMFLLDGDWSAGSTPGVIYFEGQWPTVTVIIE